MSKVCVILSGAGHLDGAELRESLFTLLTLDQRNISVEVFAPDKDQHHVINHITGEEMPEKRNVLIEAARVTRGKINPLDDLVAENFDALVIPGGFGVAKNLSDFAFNGTTAKVDKKVNEVILHFHATQKPICALCISPALLALTLQGKEPEVTVGNDEDTIKILEELGANHFKKSITDFHFDEKNRLFTTAAYMYGTGKLANIYEGVSKTINAFCDFLEGKEVKIEKGKN